MSEIENILPHRPPFLFIDSIEKNKQGPVGITNLNNHKKIMDGHFPGNPMLPGTIMLEIMAQMCGITGHYISKDIRNNSGEGEYIVVGYDRCRFIEKTTIGDALMTECDLITNKMGLARFSCKINRDSNLIASAEITCKIIKNRTQQTGT